MIFNYDHRKYVKVLSSFMNLSAEYIVLAVFNILKVGKFPMHPKIVDSLVNKLNN